MTPFVCMCACVHTYVKVEDGTECLPQSPIVLFFTNPEAYGFT